MRYQEVHRANLGVELSKEDKDIAEHLKGQRVFHIGCLVGDLIKLINDPSEVSGCEDYPLASRYAKKKNGLSTYAITTQVPDKSFDVVLLDPDYYPMYQNLLLGEAIRIARKSVIYGAKHDELLPSSVDDCKTYIINDKYACVELENDERSDSSEE